MNRHERVLVIGGTRGTGRLAAQLLAQGGAPVPVPVRVLARDPAAARARLPAAVEIVAGDVTKPATLAAALRDVHHVVFTAAVPAGRLARERTIVAVDYQGVVNTLAAAREAGLPGRFVYMNTIGLRRRSLLATVLDTIKWNVLHWRARVEAEIRKCGLDYTIVRAGLLNDRPGGERAIVVTQEELPLTPKNGIARADVAECLVATLAHAETKRATFEVVWGAGTGRRPWAELFGGLRQDR